MTSRIARLGGLAGAVALIGVVGFAQEHAAPHWSYDGANGPTRWGALDPSFAICQQGQHQSPIDIRTPKLSDLPTIQFAYRATPLHIVNNGHTIQVNYTPGS